MYNNTGEPNMCKSISFKEFREKKFNIDKISNYKLNGKCLKCGKYFEYSAVKKFVRNRQDTKKESLWETCQNCWHKINTSENLVWIKKNREAQIIAQNKPEQKEKNRKAVSKSWTSQRKAKASDLLKTRWLNDTDFAIKAQKNLSWTNGKDIDLFNKNMKKSLGSGGLRGVYKNLYYDSALELSFIMWCEDNNFIVKRFDLDPIEYLDENGKQRKYIPDFILNNNTIVEIKGLGIYFKINYTRNLLKIQAAKKHMLDYCVILSNEKVLTKNYKKARKWHNENKIQKNN